jgi:hypothetical protein
VPASDRLTERRRQNPLPSRLQRYHHAWPFRNMNPLTARFVLLSLKQSLTMTGAQGLRGSPSAPTLSASDPPREPGGT